MDSFYHKLQNDQLTEDIIQSSSEWITFETIKYAYNKEKSKKENSQSIIFLLLNNVKQHFSKICRFFIYQDNFLEYKDVLVNKLDFFKSLHWDYVLFYKISIDAVKFILDNIDQFASPIFPSEHVVFHYKIHKKWLQIYDNIDYFNLINICLLNNDIDTCNQIKQKCPSPILDSPSLVQLFQIYYYDTSSAVFKWLFEEIKSTETNLQIHDILYYILKSRDISLYEWFLNHYHSLIIDDLLFVYEEIICMNVDINYNLNILEKFITMFFEPFSQLVKENLSDLKFNTMQIYDYMNKLFNIPFTEEIFWNLFLYIPSENQYEWTKDTLNMYPHLKLTKFNCLGCCMITNTNILDFLEITYPNCLSECISVLFENSIFQRSMNIIQWYLKHYDVSIPLKEEHFSVTDLPFIQFVESLNIKIPISVYDKMIQRCAKLGQYDCMIYFKQKFPYRYNIQSAHYIYKPSTSSFKLSYSISIQYIKQIVEVKELQDCIICLDTYSNSYRTQCQHIYCKSCYDQYFQIHLKNKCAYCRQTIEEIDELKIK